MRLSVMTTEVEKEGQRRNEWNTNKDKWKRRKKREVCAREAILEGWRAQKRTAVKATVKIADGPRSLGLAPVLWRVEPAGVLASAISGFHDPVVQLAGCAVSCRDRGSWDVPGVPAGTNPILQKTNNARVRHSACGAHFYINGDFDIDGRVLWSVEPAGVLASASSGFHDPVVQLAGCAVSCRDRSALTPPTLNEPGLAATRQPRRRCPGQVHSRLDGGPACFAAYDLRTVDVGVFRQQVLAG
ncbi:hypothetical protein HPB52_001241 [Rhipicephalus sanguineus]|uniref:Uncharacterized protein n=1 Tax=Rhipicephalus sanguineus TaxID=34632 RepID=A0A9D4PTN5_RHISA|nr:hypothetical protein HPB52_001241 [Rhipicephalus sanguineus]